MDAKFLNTYNEVILDNFNAVLKQNFLFQTQIKVLEEQVKEKSELETKLASLSSENNDIVELRGEIDGLKDELNNKNLAIQNLNNTDSERHRLQTAVNNQMKEIEGLKSQVGSLQNGKDSEVQSVKIQKDSVIKLLKDKEKEQLDYIAQLEEMLPNSKKKKLGIELPTTEKELTIPVKDEMNVLKFTSNGGTF
jgi:predicted RNase H-like nuclease (RuvC/YqgF family)